MVDLEVRPLTPVTGAEILRVDLRDDLDDATIAAIRSVLVDRRVVFFRDQHLTDAEHLPRPGTRRRRSEMAASPGIVRERMVGSWTKSGAAA